MLLNVIQFILLVDPVPMRWDGKRGRLEHWGWGDGWLGLESDWLSLHPIVDTVTHFWSPSKRIGLCLLCKHIFNIPHINSVETFLLSCPSLSAVRSPLQASFMTFCQNNLELLKTVKYCLAGQPMQFILDYSVINTVISEVILLVPKSCPNYINWQEILVL